jgi:hypothetical protein
MIRRTFLSTISALAVAPLGWLLAPFASPGRQTYRLGRWAPLRYNGMTLDVWVPADPKPLAVVQGVKDSTKPAGLEIDWFAWNECPTGEHHA